MRPKYTFLAAAALAMAASGMPVVLDQPPSSPRGPGGKTKRRIKDKAAKKARKANRRKA